MSHIWIKYRHSERDTDSLIPPEVCILRALLKEGACSQGKLIRQYRVRPQQVSRAVPELRKRGLIQQDELRLTRKGEEVVHELANYWSISKKKTEWLEPIIPLANGQVGSRIINMGGGVAEIGRYIGGKFYHTHFPFMASMLVPPRDILFARSVKGTPFLSIESVTSAN
jgi:DNA-binding MarR family transcriptional regulator